MRIPAHGRRPRDALIAKIDAHLKQKKAKKEKAYIYAWEGNDRKGHRVLATRLNENFLMQGASLQFENNPPAARK